MDIKTRRHKRIRRILIILALPVILFYAVAGNLIVSAALVPSFMRKLDAFEEITEESYSQMIYTDDITENSRAASKETNEWLADTKPQKYGLESEDGYMLIAAVFLQPDLTGTVEEQTEHETESVNEQSETAARSAEEQPETYEQTNVLKGEPSHKWVMLLHGYTGWKEEMYHYACRYYAQGYNVICPDMRCQGESDGDFIGMGYTDARDNLLWLAAVAKNLDPDARFVIHGESMGAACALMMSALPELPDSVVCVIADSAYRDVKSIFRKELKDWTGLPDIGLTGASRLCLLARGGYDINKASVLDAVGSSETPTLFICGLKDRFVPPIMSEELYEACTAEKQLLQIEGAGHVQSVYKDPDAYYDTVFTFIDRFLGP